MLDSSSIDSILSFNQMVMLVAAFLVVVLVVIVCLFLFGRKSLMVKFSEVDKNLKNYYTLKAENEKLSRQKAQLDSEINELKQAKNESESSKALQAHMRQKLNELGQDYNAKLQKLRELEKELAQSQALKELIEEHKSQNLSEIDQEIQERQAKLNEVQDNIHEAQATKAMTDLVKKLHDEQTDNSLKAELDVLQAQVAEAKTDLQTNQLNDAFNKVITQIGHSVNDSLEAVGSTVAKINSLKEYKDRLKEENLHLTETQTKLQNDNNDLKSQNESLSETNSQLRLTNNELTEASSKLQEQQEQLNQQVSEVQERLSNLSSEHDQLQQKNTELTASNAVLEQTNTELNTSNKNLQDANKDLSKTNSQLQEEKNELVSQKSSLAEQINQKLENCRSLDTQNIQLNQEKTELDTNIALLKQTNEELISRNQDLTSKNDFLTAEQTQLQDTTSKLKNTQAQLAKQVNDSKAHFRNLNAHNSQLAQEQTNLNASIAELKKAKQDLLSANKGLTAENAKLNADKDSINQELSYLQQNLNSAKKELYEKAINETLDSSINTLVKGLEDAISASASKIKTAMDSINLLETETQELKSEKQSLEAEIKKLKGQLPQTQKDKDLEAYKELTNEPKPIARFMKQFMPNDQFVVDNSEIEILELFRRFMNSRGLYYSLRTITAFHTSMKVQNVNPISVLAGVSGTGKTQLAINYAKFFGMYCEHVAVQPRWDSKDDLLGFYNFLEQRYQPTKLATSLYWFDQNLHNRQVDQRNTNAHPMMLVILDEMNLARVEYYFSEFLSKLELRNSSRSAAYNSEEQSSVFLGPQNSGHKMNVSFRNVLFVGTMNEDESTFSLSDKVLDRANVLHFAPPSQFGQNAQEQEAIKPISLSAENFAKWCPSIGDDDASQSLSLDQQRQVNDYLNEINTQLEKIGKGFGHRVNRSINEYVRLYPGVHENPELLKQAFADQLEMKIIPKLSGIELNDQSEACLQSISRILEELQDEPLSQSFETAKLNFKSNNMFIWHGVKRDSANS